MNYQSLSLLLYNEREKTPLIQIIRDKRIIKKILIANESPVNTSRVNDLLNVKS